MSEDDPRRSPGLIAIQVAGGFPGCEVATLGEVAQITIPGEKGLVALLTRDGLEIRLPTLDWVTPCTPLPSTRFYKRHRIGPANDFQGELVLCSHVRHLIRRGLIARQMEFLACRYCGERVPPEHRHSKDVCHGCAERHLGVVH